MENARSSPVLGGPLAMLYNLGAAGPLTDGQLLERFLARNDPAASEAAFTVLVERHGAMVLSICRQLLGDPHEAHDAFQATFLVLVSKAASIRRREAIGGWLFGIARRVAARAHVEAARRRRHLQHLIDDRSVSGDIGAFATAVSDAVDYGPLLDEVDRLPEQLRSPVVLHYFEGLSTEATAQRLGCPRGTVLSRLSRARSRIKVRLERQGASFTALIPAAHGLDRWIPTTTVPSGLAQTTIRAAGSLALAGAAIESVVPAAVATLSRGVARTLMLSRVRVGAGIFLLAVASVSIGLAATLNPTEEPRRAGTEPIKLSPPRGAVETGERPLADEDAETRPIVFRGRVVDPEGHPFSGARLYLNYFNWSERDAAPPLRATSDADGRFRFSIVRSYFELPHLERWRNAQVVALADGFGPGGSDSDEIDAGGELTVRLARDDVPINGRLVDLEGRPVAGATVRVERTSGPTGGDLTPWIKAVNAREGTTYDLAFRYLKFKMAFANFPVPSRVTTGQDGRFTLRGIGRERVAELRVEGEAIRTMEVAVMTRDDVSVKAPVFLRRENDWMETYHPAGKLVLTATPSRPIEGIVRDRDTGAPIAGVAIRSYLLADLELSNNSLLRTRTDASGRFRITGMPLGKGNEVILMPPTDQPYLPSWERLPDLTVSQPLHVELVLKRGVWAKGKVTDKHDGRPITGSIRYGAAPDNPLLGEVPGLRGVPTNGDGTTATDLNDDGTYRIAVLPGRGILVLSAYGDNYPNPAPDEGPDPVTYIPSIYGRGDASAEIDVPADAESFRHDFALEPGRTLHGIMLDPAGKPLIGTQVYGHGAPLWPRTSETFTVSGLTPARPRTIDRLLRVRSMESLGALVLPEKPRTILFVHQAKRLASFTDVSQETKEPLEIRLQPWCVATGRIIDADGRARAGFELRPQILDKPRAGDKITPYWTYRTLTDRDGRFRLEGVVPGLRYRLTFVNSRSIQTGRGPIIAPMKPGETRDLGDVPGIIPGDPE